MSRIPLEETLEIIRDSEQETVPYNIEILGKRLVVHPGVFSPKYFCDSAYFAEIVPKLVGAGSFCEVGVGSGMVSLFVALNGGRTITGTDINPQAIQNTAENFKINGLDIDLYEGNVLDPLPSERKFDFIFWNHPFTFVDFEVVDMLSRSVFDSEFNGLKNYFATAQAHLTGKGALLLGSGDIADQDVVMTIASKNGWKLVTTHTYNSKIRVGGETPLQLFVHEFKRA